MPEILTVVTEEVETILDIYEGTGKVNPFASVPLKSKLIDYVMAQIQTDRSMRKYLSAKRTPTKFPNRSLELRLKVEDYARAGFKQLLQAAVPGVCRTSSPSLLTSEI